jgi:hypothetical protein
MRVRYKLLLTILILFVCVPCVGCDNRTSALPTYLPSVTNTVPSATSETHTATVSPSLTPTFTPTHQYKSTLLPTPAHSPSPTAFLTPTIHPEARLKIQIPKILERIPDDTEIIGTTVIHGYTDAPSYFLNMDTGAIIAPKGEIYLTSVSPNRKILAYIDATGSYENWNLVITKNLSELIIIPWEKDWLGLGNWLDNEHIVIRRKREPLLASVIVLNPFTGERKEILPDYPDIETIYYAAEWWLPVYDPTLTYVVYPRIAQDERIVLWDLQKEQAITYLTSHNNPYGLLPVWSSDGQHFVMALEDMYIPSLEYLAYELYLADCDGNVERYTYLTTYYNYLLRLDSYSWSPDNKQVAFHVAYSWGEGKMPEDQLAVLNTETREVTIFYLPGSFPHHEPVWSPDGQQLLIDGYFYTEPETGIYWTIMLDILKGYAVKIAKNSFPVGWLEYEP